VAKAYTWNFARELQSDGLGSQARVTFLNYWNAGAAIFANRHSPDDRLTRGGPMAMSPRAFDLNGWVNTDGRKPLSLNINAGINDNAAGGWGRSLGVTFNIKPSERLTLSTVPTGAGRTAMRSTSGPWLIQRPCPPSAVATSSAASINGS
jgi:hypothetical protein